MTAPDSSDDGRAIGGTPLASRPCSSDPHPLTPNPEIPSYGDYASPREVGPIRAEEARHAWRRCRGRWAKQGHERRCDLRRGHGAHHVSEQGFDVLRWTEVTL